MMLMRTAKSCGSDAPMLASSLANFRGTTVSSKPGHRGEREVSRKTIARGRPGLLRCTCGDYARVSISLQTRLRVQWAPGFPCALYSQRGETVFANLGRIAPRDCGGATSLRGANGSRECAPDDRLRDEAIHSFLARPHGLLRLRSQ